MHLVDNNDNIRLLFIRQSTTYGSSMNINSYLFCIIQLKFCKRNQNSSYINLLDVQSKSNKSNKEEKHFQQRQEVHEAVT